MTRLLRHPPRAPETPAPVVFTQVTDHYSKGSGRVDELIIGQVDPHMGNPFPRAKENQVPLLHLLHRDLMAFLVLFSRRSGQAKVENGLFEDFGKPGAIHPILGIAPQVVRRAHPIVDKMIERYIRDDLHRHVQLHGILESDPIQVLNIQSLDIDIRVPGALQGQPHHPFPGAGPTGMQGRVMKGGLIR